MPIFNSKTWTLAIKLSLTITAVVTVVGFMIGTVMVLQEWSRFHEELGEKALLLSESVAITTPKAMLRNDYWSLYLSLKNMSSRKHEIITAMILDTEGRIQAHLHPADNPMGLPFSPANSIERDLFTQAMTAREPIVISSGGYSRTGFQEGVVPLFSDQKYLGVIRVRLSVAQLYEKTKDSAFIVLALVLVFVIIGSALGTIISRRMVEPLTAVTQGLEAVGRGEMTDFAPVSVNQSDEIGRLSATFNQIMAQLAEKKMLEEEIAMSEKLVALGRITAGVAHEVNNPLAGLLNCIDTLRQHPDDKALIDRYLPVIDQGLHQIKDIVHNLLVGLKIEESDEIEGIDHIDKLQDLIVAEIGDRDIQVIWENNAGKDLQIPSKLEQIVFNLLKNAIEVLTDGGTVSFRMYFDGVYLNIEVSDDGPGIPASIRNQLFDPFFTTKPNGTGLGLWVVYRLTQNLEGIIEMESEKGQGTTFHVAIPVKATKAA
jgi:signal transduction histidine kinase